MTGARRDRSLRLLAAATGVATIACATVRATPAAPPARLASIDSSLAGATFDSAWSAIHRTYYDSTFRGLDWPGVRAELRPRAAASRTPGELRATIRAMLERIGESHFALVPAEIADAGQGETEDVADATGDVGLDIRIVDGIPVVWRVDSAGPAYGAGVRTGWTILAVDGFDAASGLRGAANLSAPREMNEARRMASARLRARLNGAAGSNVDLALADGDRRRVTVRLTRRREPGHIARFGNLPPFNVRVTHARLPGTAGCVGYIAFNIWLTPISAAVDSAMQALADCRGIVLDLRGNAGGIAGLSMGIAGYFVDTIAPLGVLKTRGNELRLVTNPRRVSLTGRPMRIYQGALAILVDRESVSTSEIFAAGLQFLRRARVFGDTTAGQALPALLRRLPNEDVLLHVFSDYTLPDGTRLEARGVIPDEVHRVTRPDLLAGRDAPLSAAVSWVSTVDE